MTGLPDPSVLLDRAGRVLHFNRPRRNLRRRCGVANLPSRRCVARDHRDPAAGARRQQAAAHELCRSRADRPVDGTGGDADSGSDPVRRLRHLHADDVSRPDAAAAGGGNARRFRRQCQPRAAYAAGGAVRLHRYAAGSGKGRHGRARALSRDHARAGHAHGAADRRPAVAVAHRAQRACAAERSRRPDAAAAPGGRTASNRSRTSAASSCRWIFRTSR